MYSIPTVDAKFTLGEKVTSEEIEFFNKYGFIHYKNFISKEQVAEILKSLDDASDYLVKNNIQKINGIPLKFGVDHTGKKFVNRMPYSSRYAKAVADLFSDARFNLLKVFIPDYELRIGIGEKDGVVSNHYLNTEKSGYRQLGWHTDVIRDFFMGKKMYPMLNVGIYLTDSDLTNGGLRVLPGTHKQSVWSMLFKKMQAVNTKTDPNEVVVLAEAGDLCLHGGRLWHRVGRSPFNGERSRRRVMYVPFLCGPLDERNENSPTPLYQLISKRYRFR